MSDAGLTDEEIVDFEIEEPGGAKFALLFHGRWQGLYPSQSEADLDLCVRLARMTNSDALRIDQIFRKSALMRDKWHRCDYRERTISRAIEIEQEDLSKKGYPLDWEKLLTQQRNLSSICETPKNPKPTTQSSRFVSHSISELKSAGFSDVEWVWRGYCAIGSVTVMAGKPKCGKTTLIMGLLKSGSKSRSFLDRVTSISGTLFLTEEHPSSICEKIARFEISPESNLRFMSRRLNPHDTLENYLSFAVEETKKMVSSAESVGCGRLGELAKIVKKGQF